MKKLFSFVGDVTKKALRLNGVPKLLKVAALGGLLTLVPSFVYGQNNKDGKPTASVPPGIVIEKDSTVTVTEVPCDCPPEIKRDTIRVSAEKKRNPIRLGGFAGGGVITDVSCSPAVGNHEVGDATGGEPGSGGAPNFGNGEVEGTRDPNSSQNAGGGNNLPVVDLTNSKDRAKTSYGLIAGVSAEQDLDSIGKKAWGMTGAVGVGFKGEDVVGAFYPSVYFKSKISKDVTSITRLFSGHGTDFTGKIQKVGVMQDFKIDVSKKVSIAPGAGYAHNFSSAAAKAYKDYIAGKINVRFALSNKMGLNASVGVVKGLGKEGGASVVGGLGLDF